MMICYHPKCIRKPFVTLKHICDISDYILHLASHTDELGRCMFERFKLLKKNIFVDDFASQVSPNLLLGSEGPQIDEVKTLPHMKKFTILRQLGKDSNGLRLTYVCHWKDILIKEGCITSQSLSFQEDDALAEMALAYPNPVQDWAKYRTISFYGLKLMCSTSSTAVALHRGVTKYPCFTKVDPEMLRRKEFMRNINHPSAAISTMKGWFPKVTYEREQYHGKNHKLHLRLLSKAKAGQGVVLVFPGVRRIPVSTVIDEQELNQGTFVEKGILYGLAEPLDAAKIREIGLENLANYIATKCPFQHSVREYRITDLSGSYCSSMYTQYLAGSFKTEECVRALQLVNQLTSKCESCVYKSKVCSLKSLREKCEECVKDSCECVSFTVFHVFWDMGSCHKSAANVSNKLTSSSTGKDFEDPSLHSFGFGGLHLAKSPTNCLRNHVLSLEGQNYGLNILRALKNTSGSHTEVLKKLKTCVIVGKDRQSDYLSYSVTGPIVQEALKVAKHYKCVKIPEPVLKHKDEAKAQKQIVFPTGVHSNTNGDFFLVDSGGSCIYGLDRSNVTRMHTVGTYRVPSYKPYLKHKIMKTKDICLSDNILDIHIPNFANILYIVDSGRSELIVIRDCSTAKSITSSFFNIFARDGIKSVCAVDDDIIMLTEEDGSELIERITLELPKSRESSHLKIAGKVKKRIPLSTQNKFVFLACPDVLGLVDTEREIEFFPTNLNKVANLVKSRTGFKTAVKPQIVEGKLAYLTPNSKQLNFINVHINKKDKHIVHSESLRVIDDIPAKTLCVGSWGKTIITVSFIENMYKVLEFGKLDFALKYSEALSSFYRGICYLPPHGYKDRQRLTLHDSISLAEPLLHTLTAIQQERKERFPTLNSFQGVHGPVFTSTTNCIEVTIDSWKAIINRLTHFDPNLVEKVNPHSVTSEAPMEHSFGFITKKGQGNLLNAYEYAHNKSNHEIEFQMKLSKMAFCQDIKTKLRDKSYQELDGQFDYHLNADDLWEILFRKRGKEDETEEPPVDDEDAKLVYNAFLISKSVPRRSNRAKWKEESGFAPNPLVEKEDEWKVYPGDIVFCKDVTGVIKSYVIQKMQSMTNVNQKVKVKEVGSQVEIEVPISSLATERGLIAVVPQNLYEIDGSHVAYSDIASAMWQFCVDEAPHTYTDQELADLEVDLDTDNLIEEESNDRGSSIEIPAVDFSHERMVDYDMGKREGPGTSKEKFMKNKKEPAMPKKREDFHDEDEDDELMISSMKIKKRKKSRRLSDSDSDADSGTLVLPSYHDIASQAQDSISNSAVGNYYCVYYDEGMYWAKLINASPENEKVIVDFLHYKCDEIWDYPRLKNEDVWKGLHIDKQFVFFGPCTPSYHTAPCKGYKFSEDSSARAVYREIKSNNKH